jgi:formylglycine-generating enzyme required for sulfatase activity
MLRALLALLCVMLIGSVNAETSAAPTVTVEAIQSDITSKQTEYDSNNLALQAQMNEAKQMKTELSDLREKLKLREREKSVALEEMNAQFQRMIKDPSLDIAASRSRYTESVNAHKQNQKDIEDQLIAVEDKERQVAGTRVLKLSLLNTLEGLKEQLNKSRVERLYTQFNKPGQMTVQQSFECDLEKTLSECIRQTETLAKQQASDRYMDKIFAELSESKSVATQREGADTSVKIVKAIVTEKAFSGFANYSLTMAVDLAGNLTRPQACKLLELNQRFCVADSVKTNTVPAANTPAGQNKPVAPVKVAPKVMHEMTVRSNVFGDEVYINGVSYGSTKLSVMLPEGKHSVEIVKVGYKTYVEYVDLKQNHMINVNLVKETKKFSKGSSIQDSIGDNKQGPRLVAVTAGDFKMGDITGRGLDNERPVVSYTIEESFGMGEKEITVADFAEFITATKYVTVAEQGKGCAYYSDSEPKYDPQMNWRNPGYEQTEIFPVVCVTLDDAKAYVEWLSNSTNKNYRLPTEGEWEYAARSGSSDDYWWGDAIGSNNANCGWCGSEWSNNSAAPTASFKRNYFGLYDVIGNVWEWSDSGSEQVSVVRGGAWNFAPSLARVSTRLEIASNFRSNYIGFRVARDR